MSILACSGFDEGPGANYTPPTLGNFMQKQALEQRRLREARAGNQVIKEAREFHEHQARKHGLNTNRGMAHFRASKMFVREGNRLQEMFDQGGQDHSELPPKAVMKASKAAMKFHKGQAEKAGLDTDLGHAHVAAMEHHADIHKKAKAQHQQSAQQGQPMQASAEGGPGSGPRKGMTTGGTHGKNKTQTQYMSKKDRDERDARNNERDMKSRQDAYQKWTDRDEHPRTKLERDRKSNKEAAPGFGGRQSPVPVPKKSDQPSDDIQDPQAIGKPPVKLNPQDANKPMRKLQQNESRESRIRNFGKKREGRRGPDDGMERAEPRGAGTLMDDDLVYRGPRTKESRRSLRRPIWESDDSEWDRSDSGLTA